MLIIFLSNNLKVKLASNGIFIFWKGQKVCVQTIPLVKYDGFVKSVLERYKGWHARKRRWFNTDVMDTGGIGDFRYDSFSTMGEKCVWTHPCSFVGSVGN